jgi:hypothetical protein
MVNIFKKVDGTVSVANTLNILVFALAVIDIFKIFVPAQYVAYVVAVVAVINVYVRIFVTNGVPIEGSPQAKG